MRPAGKRFDLSGGSFLILIFDKKLEEGNEKNLTQSEDNDNGGLAPA